MKTRKHILIADDNAGIQDAFQIYFDKAGYVVSIYPDGNILLTDGYKLPDLYILDKQLSGIDGLDICKFLKGQEHTKKIPVIMISATPQVKSLAVAAGAEDFLEKPFKMHDLLQLVRKHLETHG